MQAFVASTNVFTFTFCFLNTTCVMNLRFGRKKNSEMLKVYAGLCITTDTV